MKQSMQQVALGGTGIRVSRLCFGTGTCGTNCESIQSKLAPERFGELLVEAHQRGLTFWDTSDDYGTYPHVRWAIERLPRSQLTITTKTWASGKKEARKSLLMSLRDLGLDYVDVLLLHEVDSPAEFERRQGALEALHEAKQAGLVRAVGLSTHAILTLEAVVKNPLVEVLLTNYNKHNAHMDAGLADYTRALEAAHQAGQGVMVMKTLHEGRLAHDVRDCLAFNLQQPFIDSVLMGMETREQLLQNVAIQQEVDPCEILARQSG